MGTVGVGRIGIGVDAGGRAAPIGRAEAMREALELQAVLADSAGTPLSCGWASIPPSDSWTTATVNVPQESEGSLP